MKNGIIVRKIIEKKQNFIPNINKHLVFDVIRKYGPTSISKIIKLTNLSIPTVLKIIKDLTNNNYINIKGKGESNGGRKPFIYDFNANARFFIGVEFEIPKVKIIAINLKDIIITRTKYNIIVSENSDTIVNNFISKLWQIKQKSEYITNGKLAGIGVAISGFIDSKKGISISTPRIPHWRNVAIGKYIEKKFNVPVYLINDADASMMAEIKFGLKGMIKDLIYINFNEGLGAGLLVNGNLIKGKYGNAGLIGHTTVNPNGLKCICGNKGCLETYASERGILSMVRHRYKKDDKKFMDELTFEEVIKLYQNGDPIVTEVFEKVLYYLGIGIANIINLLEIGHIIIGGSIVKAGNDFLNLLEQEIRSHLQNILKMDLVIEYSNFRHEEAGAIGAVIPIMNEFFKVPKLMLNKQESETLGTYVSTSGLVIDHK